MNSKTIALSALILLAVAGGSFYGGMKYGQSQASANKFAGAGGPGNFQSGMNGTSTRNGIKNSGGMVAGEIISKDEGSVTVKLNDGGSKIVLLSSSTKTTKQTDAAADDLAAGTKVNIMGTTNSDGSVSAQSVQIMTDGSMPSAPEGGAPQSPGNSAPSGQGDKGPALIVE